MNKPIGSRGSEILTKEYASVNAAKTVPALQDGDLVVVESGAIVNYICSEYGQKHDLCPPANNRDRSQYDMWCFFSLMELDANTLYIVWRHGDLHSIYGEAPVAVETAKTIFGGN